MHHHFRNVNEALRIMVGGLYSGKFPHYELPSRDGEVIKLDEPQVVTYYKPRERVLFNRHRDANPFFHLYESLWMLAGRDDLAPLVYYNSKMARFTDDGVTQPDAYGKRWRSYFPAVGGLRGRFDQLDWIVERFTENKYDRRPVLCMWDPGDDPRKANENSKGVPCNLACTFEVEEERELSMTVFNRSNDMLLGMFGANVVHFSFLQEYLACRIGLEVGRYHQISSNLHVYTEKGWNPQELLESDDIAYYAADREDQTVNGGVATSIPLVKDPARFEHELLPFVDDPQGVEPGFSRDWGEPFLDQVAKPMLQAFRHHKARQYDLAYEALDRIVGGEDWNVAGYAWLKKREEKWKENPYQAREDIRASQTRSN